MTQAASRPATAAADRAQDRNVRPSTSNPGASFALVSLMPITFIMTVLLIVALRY
jgi:hypothetical protein